MALLIVLLFAQNPSQARVSFWAVGDILLDRGIRRKINEHNADYPFENISMFINTFDLAFCNLECPVSAMGKSTGKVYCFRADTNFFSGIKKAGCDIFCLANNHIIDWGSEACLDTKARIAKHGLYAVGAGKNEQEASQPLIISMNGLKIAILASVGIPLKDIIWPRAKPGPNQATLEQLVQNIEKIDKCVDFVIVSMHWGTEYEHIPRPHQQEWAHSMINAGADLIIGHHPHVLQSIEMYGDRVILYSLGNFVFDQRKLYQRQSGIFSCIFKKGRIDSACFYPVLVKNFQPGLADDTMRADIESKMEKISNVYNMEFFKITDQLYITDSTRALLFHTPLFQTIWLDNNIVVKRNSFDLFDPHKALIDSLEFDDSNEIKDCCTAEYSDRLYIFTLQGSVDEQFSQYIAQFLITDNMIIPQYCLDNKDYRPWKILSADIDCDSISEICVGVRKTASIGQFPDQLYIYKWNGNNISLHFKTEIKPITFTDYTFSDLDKDGLDDLCVLEPGNDGTNRLIVYQWIGIGFSKYRELGGIKENWLSSIDIDALFNENKP